MHFVCCARSVSLENGWTDYFYFSDSHIWELVSTLAFVCPPDFTEWVYLQRHRHTQTPVTAPCFGGTLTGIWSSPCFSTMLPQYPEIQLRQVLWEHFSSPALNISEPQSTDSQIPAERQSWYLSIIIHDIVILLGQSGEFSSDLKVLY